MAFDVRHVEPSDSELIPKSDVEPGSYLPISDPLALEVPTSKKKERRTKKKAKKSVSPPDTRSELEHEMADKQGKTKQLSGKVVIKKKIFEATPLISFGSQESESFIRYTGGYYEVMRLKGYNLYGMSEAEVYGLLESYATLASLYTPPFKIVNMTTNVDTMSQQAHFKTIIRKSLNKEHRRILQQKHDELQFIGRHRQNEEFLVMIYGYDEKILRENIEDFLLFKGSIEMTPLTREEKIALHFKLNNPGVKTQPELPKNVTTRNKRLLAEGYDLAFISAIQPLGNLRFTEIAVKTGNGWSTCINTYKLKSEPDDLWLMPFTRVKDKILTIDVATQNMDQVISDIDSVTMEQDTKRRNEKNPSIADIANEEYHSLVALGKDVRKKREVMKFITIRLYLYAESLDALEKRVMETIKLLDNDEFGVTNYTLEQKQEWQSLFLDYHSQTGLPNRRSGLDIASTEFGASFPPNYVKLSDPYGEYLGSTNTGGNLIFDPFEVDNDFRTFFNLLILGTMGKGKSTLMKKLLRSMAAKGYKIRGFDKSGEFTRMVKRLGGVILRLDGQDGILNIFEIFPLVINELTQEIDERGCLFQHTSKLTTWYSIIKPDVTNDEVDEFDIIVNKLYRKWDFIAEDGSEVKVTGLDPTAYPTLSDLMVLIDDELSQDVEVEKRTFLIKIKRTLTKLIQVQGHIFDGHTTFQNLSETQILFFNIDGISAYDKRYTDAQLFNAFNLFAGTLMNHGKNETKRYNAGTITFEEICRGMFFMDECHNLINVRNPRMITYTSTFEREGRKANVGMCLATQSLRSLIPEGMGDEVVDMLKEVYEFMQYRFYFYFPPTTLPLLKYASAGELTETQISQIGKYRQGQCLLSINGGESYEFFVDATKEELDLFDGGGKKSSN